MIVGPEGVAKAYQYKESMHDIELVSKSLSVQLGNELMPAVISIAAAMNDKGAGGAAAFGHAIKELVRDLQEAVVYWGAGFDKLSAFLANLRAAGLVFNKKAMMEDIANIQYAEQESLEAIAKAYDTKPKVSETPTGDLNMFRTRGEPRSSRVKMPILLI